MLSSMAREGGFSDAGNRAYRGPEPAPENPLVSCARLPATACVSAGRVAGARGQHRPLVACCTRPWAGKPRGARSSQMRFAAAPEGSREVSQQRGSGPAHADPSPQAAESVGSVLMEYCNA